MKQIRKPPNSAAIVVHVERALLVSIAVCIMLVHTENSLVSIVELALYLPQLIISGI